MKIRIADKFDIPKLREMLLHYLGSNPVENLKITDETTGMKILTTLIVGGGLALVSEKDNEITGMLLALKHPFLWDQNQFVMTEIAYWVEPEHRHSTAGYRLLSKYVELCDELRESEKIMNFTISQMEGQKLNYSKFGFKPIEHTWSA